MLAGEQGDDAVGLTQLLGAQHDRLVAVQAHPAILPRAPTRHRRRGARRPPKRPRPPTGPGPLPSGPGATAARTGRTRDPVGGDDAMPAVAAPAPPPTTRLLSRGPSKGPPLSSTGILPLTNPALAPATGACRCHPARLGRRLAATARRPDVPDGDPLPGRPGRPGQPGRPRRVRRPRRPDARRATAPPPVVHAWAAPPPTTRPRPATGDWVLLVPHPGESAAAAVVGPRCSPGAPPSCGRGSTAPPTARCSRRTSTSWPCPRAGPGPRPRPHRAPGRAGLASGGAPVVVLTKSDLAPDPALRPPRSRPAARLRRPAVSAAAPTASRRAALARRAPRRPFSARPAPASRRSSTPWPGTP